MPFPKRIKLKHGETLVYGAVEFKSEAHHNKVMKAIFADPAMTAMMPKKPPFDYKRMVCGGFKILCRFVMKVAGLPPLFFYFRAAGASPPS